MFVVRHFNLQSPYVPLFVSQLSKAIILKSGNYCQAFKKSLFKQKPFSVGDGFIGFFNRQIKIFIFNPAALDSY